MSLDKIIQPSALDDQKELDLEWEAIQNLESLIAEKKELLLIKAIEYKKRLVYSRWFDVVDTTRIDSTKAKALCKIRNLNPTITYSKFNGKKAKELLGIDTPYKTSQYLKKKPQSDYKEWVE